MRWLWSAAATALLMAACSTSGTTLELEESPAQVEVDIAAGAVTITGQANVSGTSVETVILRGEPDPMIELADGVLTIADSCTDSEECAVDYMIFVEGDAADVKVTTGDGSVAVSNLTGTVTIDAAAGDVGVTSLIGDITVTLGTGDVLGTRLSSVNATFETGRGDIDVSFDDPTAMLVATTADGDVTAQLPEAGYAFDTQAPGGSVESRIDDDPGAANVVRLATDTGDITVYRN